MRMKTPLFCAAVLLGVCFALPGSVSAVMLSSDLAVSGEMELYIVPAADIGTGSASGSYYSRVGGVDTTTLFDGSGVTSGSDPLVGSPTHTGDGFGSTFSIAAGFEADFLIGLDLAMSLTNNSATDTYALTLGIDYSNSVNADGNIPSSESEFSDAYAESEFVVEDASATELFFSHVVSDTLIGDELAGSPLGSFGNPVTDIGTTSLSVLLAPGDIFDLYGIWNWQGGVYEDPGLSSIELSSFISIDSFENRTTPPNVIPEPGTFLLLGSGLVGLACYARRKRRL